MPAPGSLSQTGHCPAIERPGAINDRSYSQPGTRAICHVNTSSLQSELLASTQFNAVAKISAHSLFKDEAEGCQSGSASVVIHFQELTNKVSLIRQFENSQLTTTSVWSLFLARRCQYFGRSPASYLPGCSCTTPPPLPPSITLKPRSALLCPVVMPATASHTFQ